MIQYLAYTTDEFETCIGSADTLGDLAGILRISPVQASSVLWEQTCTGEKLGYYIVRIDIEDYDEDEGILE